MLLKLHEICFNGSKIRCQKFGNFSHWKCSNFKDEQLKTSTNIKYKILLSSWNIFHVLTLLSILQNSLGKFQQLFCQMSLKILKCVTVSLISHIANILARLVGHNLHTEEIAYHLIIMARSSDLKALRPSFYQRREQGAVFHFKPRKCSKNKREVTIHHGHIASKNLTWVVQDGDCRSLSYHQPHSYNRQLEWQFITWPSTSLSSGVSFWESNPSLQNFLLF